MNKLNSININVPPLRKRKEDIKTLFLKFANDFNIKYNKKIQNIDEKCFTILEEYNWPGNIRQLKNFTEKINEIFKMKSSQDLWRTSW